VDDNATWQSATYGAAGGNDYVTPLGAVISIYKNSGDIPSYECDFFSTVWAFAMQNGETGFTNAFNNTARYTVGRFTTAVQSAGFCTSHACGYWLMGQNTGKTYWINNWNEFFQRNYSGESCQSQIKSGAPAYPDWAGGYAAVARGMLAACANANHPDALTAFNRLVSMTPSLEADMRNDPSYYIVPRA
jgi:hypothetical protein